MTKIRLPRWFFLAALVAITVYVGVEGPEDRAGGGGEAKKTSTGRSFMESTVVEAAPSPSAAAAGWDLERVWGGQDDWEPAIAVDPVVPTYVYQLTTRYTGPAACKSCKLPAIIFRASSDGGATWGADKFIAASTKTQNDPQIEVAADGTVFAVWLTGYNPGVTFSKSTDHGANWSTPKTFIGKGAKPSWSDKPILAISRNGQDVYIAFNASDSYIVSSHDSGNTFSAPFKTNGDTRYWFHNSGVVSAASGNVVYFGAANFSSTYVGDANIDVIRSTNGGVSWTTTQVDTSRQMPDCPWAAGCTLGFLGTSNVIAMDVNGTLMIAYHANSTPSAPEQMYVRTSTDGVTWSARTQISDPSSAVNNGFPAIAAGPTAGDFRVAWQDDRNGSTTAWNTWYRRTTNGGGTWSTAVRLSDQSGGAPYKTAAGYAFPYGDYFEMAVDSNGRNYVIWGEGASYSGPGGTWYTRGQ
jgi:hypothetical protein